MKIDEKLDVSIMTFSVWYPGNLVLHIKGVAAT